MKKVTVSDITLKAIKEQDLSLTFREKLLLAEKLDSLMVDSIELPSVSSCKEDRIIYRTISESIKSAKVKIPVGASLESLECAYDCVQKAKNPCLQIVMPVSTVQMEYFYHLKAPAMMEKIVELTKSAHALCDNVELVMQDAFRAEKQFVLDCAKSACIAGAKEITVCDDAGDAFPEDYFDMVKSIKSVCEVKVCVQPSNKLSMSASCAVQAIIAGADGVKTSISGQYLSLSVFADIIRAKKFTMDVDCSVDVTNVKTLSSNVLKIAEPNEDNAEFTAKNIESSATLKEVSDTIKSLGYELSDSDVGKVYEEFKKLAGKKEAIDTKELEAIVASTAMQVPSTYHLVNYVVNSGNIIPATANVTLEKDGEKFTGVSTGDGPIDAAFHAIEQVIGHHYDLDDFQVHAVTKGRGAVGSSLIRLRADGKLYPGNGVSTDIVGACIRAYINALNKIVYEEN